MKILGVDPGTRNCGYAIIESDPKLNLIEAGCLKLKATTPLPKRIEQIYDFLVTQVMHHGITHIAIETPFFGKNHQTFLKLGYVRGIIYLVSQQQDCILFEYSPSVVKQALTAWGAAPKEHVSRVVRRMFPTLPATAGLDVTDAVAIGLTGIWKK